jgi:hypothetical protein
MKKETPVKKGVQAGVNFTILQSTCMIEKLGLRMFLGTKTSYLHSCMHII